MGYINEFMSKLRLLIEQGKYDEAVKFGADTCLESYRNGLKTGTEADKQDVSKAKRFAERVKAK
jgi:hypothetical protein